MYTLNHFVNIQISNLFNYSVDSVQTADVIKNNTHTSKGLGLSLPSLGKAYVDFVMVVQASPLARAARRCLGKLRNFIIIISTRFYLHIHNQLNILKIFEKLDSMCIVVVGNS